MFVLIGAPPQPVSTRWGTWIQATMYYAENLTEVKSIVDSFEGKGVITEKVKESVKIDLLRSQLRDIAGCYSVLSTKWRIRYTLL